MKIKIKPCKISKVRNWLNIPYLPDQHYNDLKVLSSGGVIDAWLHNLGCWCKNYNGREYTVAFSDMAYEVKEDEQ